MESRAEKAAGRPEAFAATSTSGSSISATGVAEPCLERDRGSEQPVSEHHGLSRLLALADSPSAPGGVEGEKIVALREWRNAQVARDEAERKLQALERDLVAGLTAAPAPPKRDHDGWAPRDLPLVPSPIHRQLLTAEELASRAIAPEIRHVQSLPKPGTVPDLTYLPWWKRPVADLLSRVWLVLGGFLALPQRRINDHMLEVMSHMAAELQQMRRGLESLAERSSDNFRFFDECQRDQLLESHRQNDLTRSECRGEILRQQDLLRQELEAMLEQKSPRHRLALLDLELAVARAKSQIAWQRLLAAELGERLEAAEARIAKLQG